MHEMNLPENLNTLSEEVRCGRAIFLAGSGISLAYPSCLPSSPALIAIVSRLALPEHGDQKTNEENSDLISKIQPEVFYGRLQSIIGDDALRVFSALSADKCQGVPLGPTLSHLFLVDYAQKHDLPILTTNFDLRFEQAAKLLGFELPVLEPQSLEKLNLNASIVKIHGSLSENRDNVSSLCATMPRIVAPSSRLTEMLKAEANSYCLCLVGYSGRDIDLFPLLKEAYSGPGAQKVFWVDPNFKADGSNSSDSDLHNRQRRLRAYAVAGRFDEVVPLMSERVTHYKAAQGIAWLNLLPSSKYLTNSLLDEAEETAGAALSKMSKAQKILFRSLLLNAVGSHKLEDEYLDLHYDELMQSLNKREQVVASLARSHLCDCVSKYADCVKFSEEALRRLDTLVAEDCAWPEKLCLRIQIMDTKLMGKKMEEGPDVHLGCADVDFSPSKSKMLRILLFGYIPWTLYSRFSLSLSGLLLRPFRWRLLLRAPKPEDEVFLLDAWHKYSGFYIMLVSFWQRVVEVLPCPDVIRSRHLIWLAKFRRRIDLQIGNALGVAHWDKFIHQVENSNEAAERAYEEYALLTNPLNAARPHRTRGEALFRNGMRDEAAREFAMCLKLAEECGSRAEVLKAYAGLIACRQLPAKSELKNLRDSVQGDGYRRFADRLIKAIEVSQNETFE